MLNNNIFHAEVWENNYETSLIKNGIINYFTDKGLKVFFKHTNPFELLNECRIKMALGVISSFAADSISADLETQRAAFGIKYLAEELQYKDVTAPLAYFYDGNQFLLTKGNKKVQAMALNNITSHPSFIVSSVPMKDAFELKNDYQLFDLLQMIDQKANKFYIRIEYINDVPRFHFMVNSSTISNWINVAKCKEYLNYKRSYPCTIFVIGNCIIKDKDLKVIQINNKIESVSAIDILHINNLNKYEDYFCTIYSTNEIELDKNYLEYINYNSYTQNMVRFAYIGNIETFKEASLIIKFNNSGINSKVFNIW